MMIPNEIPGTYVPQPWKSAYSQIELNCCYRSYNFNNIWDKEISLAQPKLSTAQILGTVKKTPFSLLINAKKNLRKKLQGGEKNANLIWRNEPWWPAELKRF